MYKCCRFLWILFLLVQLTNKQLETKQVWNRYVFSADQCKQENNNKGFTGIMESNGFTMMVRGKDLCAKACWEFVCTLSSLWPALVLLPLPSMKSFWTRSKCRNCLGHMTHLQAHSHRRKVSRDLRSQYTGPTGSVRVFVRFSHSGK